MNTSSNENGYASDDKCVFYYQLGLISSGIWSTFVVTIDAIYETSFFAPHTFCMNTSTERTMQQILFTLLMLVPYILDGIFAFLTETNWERDLFNAWELSNSLGITSRKIPFRTLLFSVVVLVFVLILPFAFHCASWLIANADWQPIILCFILISIDVLKVPLQLKWKFKENTLTPSNHRRITEDQRIISLQHSSQEKLTSTNV